MSRPFAPLRTIFRKNKTTKDSDTDSVADSGAFSQCSTVVEGQEAEEQEARREGLIDLNPGFEEHAKSAKKPQAVDIIAVPELDGDPLKSWAHEGAGSVWLRDTLPEDLPGARVFSFGYPADLLSGTSRATLRDIAAALLAALEAKRMLTERRPLIFIAHGLGGVICKKALVMALKDPSRKCVVTDTAGLMVFGTPQRWIPYKPVAANMLADMHTLNVWKAGGKLAEGKARHHLVKSLMSCALDIREYNQQYLLDVETIPMTSFYETEETPLFKGKLVSPLIQRRSSDM